jgi:hypothetical protein
MKTNTIHAITAAVLTGLLAGFGSTTVTGNILTGLTVAVSSWAAVALIAMIAADYRSSPKGYFATTTVTTGHFKGTPSNALRAAGAKTRLAA